MSKKKQRKPNTEREPGEEKPSGEAASGSDQSTPERTNGDTPADDMVDIEAFLAEISARLVTAGSVPLIQPQPVQVEPVERTQIMVFALNGVRYAVEMDYVGEVALNPDVTRVPGLPDWVLGVTNLHGDIVSVVDLSRFLEVGAPTTRHDAKMIVAQAADQRIGLMVDDVERVYTFPTERVLSAPFKVEPGVVGFLRGAVEHDGRFVRLLDCERLLLGPQMQQFS